MNTSDLISRHQAAITLNYGKLPVALIKGQGSRVTDADGKTYIDLFAGFGGTILGHCHPDLVKAIEDQARAIWATGNQFYTEPQIRLAEHLTQKAFGSVPEGARAFFCHSGAEANEAAIKLARLSAGEGRFKIISMLKGFHGRTMGALSATPTPEYQKGFTPLTPGFGHVPYNDLAALEAAIDKETAGIILEPIQGEGGMNVPTPGYLAGVRALADKHNVCLIFDEVWTGCARTGKYFGHQYEAGVTPDIITLGKALGGGIPVGAMIARTDRAQLLKPGTHGCTLGGNPICAAVAAKVFDVIDRDNLCAHATQLGDKAVAQIKSFKNAGKIKAVRGRGLFLGIELNVADGSPALNAALPKGVFFNVTQKNVIRICPAVTIDETTLREGLALVDDALAAL